jgi:acetyl-CoA C-acetyltransferase
MNEDDVVIVSAARTPMGSFMGSLSTLSATDLGAAAISGALQKERIDISKVDEVIMGTCLMAGLGQAPARQATLKAGLPYACGATTLTKMCGSAMKSVMLAYDIIRSGSADVIVAGGMESMSNAPHLLLNTRKGYRLGAQVLHDHMLIDGLEDAYEKGRLMGSFAEDCVSEYGFTREEQDAYATTSYHRAKEANESGAFAWEITPIDVMGKSGVATISKDEGPYSLNVEKTKKLKPAFKKDGTITAHSSSPISDGAAALVLMRYSTARQMGVQPIARVIGHATYAQEPSKFATAPAKAIEKLLNKLSCKSEDIDLYEVNEAFAAVTMGTMIEHQIPHEKMNVHGGACALGHPVGASGARIIVTLLGALHQKGLKTGIASLCLGGGEATAVAVEIC